MFYLAIESSCDETSLAILQLESNFCATQTNFYDRLNSIKVVSSIISSQVQTHAVYGGVVPEIGARLHAEQIHKLFQIVLDNALEQLQIDQTSFYNQLETIFVTSEPGLTSALRVGVEFAKSIQFYISKQTQKSIYVELVNHLQGHIVSSFYKLEPKSNFELDKHIKTITNSNKEKIALSKSILELVNNSNTLYPDEIVFPHLHLIISGGNTQIRLLRSWHDWQIVGQTIDDAAGECFDKTARMIGIPYPGGATLSKIAGQQYLNPLNLPIAMMHSKDLNISLSGLKTAVRYKIEKSNIPNLTLDELLLAKEIEDLISQKHFEVSSKLQFVRDICTSTQFAIVEQIKLKIDQAVQSHRPNSIGISGGVSANNILVQKIQDLDSVQALQVSKVFQPNTLLTGDNAIMIGLAGLVKINFNAFDNKANTQHNYKNIN